MSGWPRKRAFFVVALGSCFFGWLIFEHGAKNYCCDATAYVRQSLEFSASGVLGAHSQYMDFRPYGYPFFIALVSLITNHDFASIHIAVAIAQLILLVLTAYIFATTCARLTQRRPVVIMAAIALNPLLLVAATATLSDLLSALCAATAVALVFARRGHRPGTAFASLAFAGIAAVVRPASVVFVPMVSLFWVVRGVYLRRLSLASYAALWLGMVLPFVPQMLNNRRLFGSWSPLIVRHLYADQMRWGMQYLKYGTLIPAAPLYYVNPWYSSDSATIGQWLMKHPLHCAATLAMHLFALFDQDYGFVYVANIHPWYRWPLTILNLTYLLVALVSIGALVVRMIGRRRIGATGFFTLAIACSCIGYVMVYAPTAVESRFSLPVYLLLSPFFAIGVSGLREVATKRPVKRRAILLCGGSVGAIAVGCLLSRWLAMQAPALR